MPHFYKKTKKKMNLNNIKTVDLSVHLNSFSVEISKDFIKEGPIILKSSLFYSRNLPLSHKGNGMTSFGMKGKVVKYERILDMYI